MPQYAVLIYADESIHAQDASEAELEENDRHARALEASPSTQRRRHDRRTALSRQRTARGSDRRVGRRMTD